jgi:hypothetical protein
VIEEIYDGKTLLAIILRANYSQDGIQFFTPKEFSQQLGYMKRPKGYIVQAHIHMSLSRAVFLTQEVLFIKNGKLRMDIFDLKKTLVKKVVLQTGDVVLLASGGHGFEMLEECEIIEVKTGPHLGDKDKTRF